jgi:hypothetical protein
VKTLTARSPATRGWAVDAIVTVVAVVDEDARRLFSDEFDDSFPVGTHEGNNAYYGRNVLRGPVDGIDDFTLPSTAGCSGSPRC